MRYENDRLAAEILKKAHGEFLAKGFRKASVRDIAKAAKVTTGALYRYYANKEALFDALVSEPADFLYEQLKTASDNFSKQPAAEQLLRLPEESSSGMDIMIDYIYDNYDAFRLIACCAEGSSYADYAEKLKRIEERSSNVLIKKLAREGIVKEPLDGTLVHIISSTFFSGLFEIISHDAKREKAAPHIKALHEFYAAGWFRLLGI